MTDFYKQPEAKIIYPQVKQLEVDFLHHGLEDRYNDINRQRRVLHGNDDKAEVKLARETVWLEVRLFFTLFNNYEARRVIAGRLLGENIMAERASNGTTTYVEWLRKIEVQVAFLNGLK